MHVTYDQLVAPALRHLSGEQVPPPLLFRVRSASGLQKRPGRVEYQRGILAPDDQGQLVVSKTGPQGSGILNSMRRGNCYIILPYESDGVAVGEYVTVQPFSACF